MNGVDTDGMRRQLDGQCLHQSDDGVFGGCVRASAGCAAQTGRGAGDHDGGARARTVFHTPVTLMSSVSSQRWFGISQTNSPEPRMLALADTMSIRPNS